ncbi:hypothetical protein PoB_006866400 [Plakobranchus ocellatus]|uniref:Uncharacterized protein n=1 Tax=Plakobranchus ocellatus TaxID=259542 RepID=A0AAV4DD91_9GAST|nr:hypothetical protein PoB_006866400 [Plakobranchus ocellatus]
MFQPFISKSDRSLYSRRLKSCSEIFFTTMVPHCVFNPTEAKDDLRLSSPPGARVSVVASDSNRRHKDP